jgi:putative transposase
MERKKWSKQEKLAVLEEAKVSGVEVTLRKHGIYPSTFYDWQSKVLAGGESGLDRAKRTTKTAEYLAELESENKRLTFLLGQKELEIDLQKEMLKKKYPMERKKI